MTGPTALIATPDTERLLRLRRVLAPLVTAVSHHDPNALPTLAVSTRACLVVVDLDSIAPRGGRVVEAARSLAGRILVASPSTAVVLMCRDLGPDDELGLMMAGYAAVYRHGVDDATLSRILRATLRGEVCLRRELVGRLVRRAARERTLGPIALTPGSPEDIGTPPARAASTECPPDVLSGLTVRERDIARQVGAGRSNKAIAALLGITERTVKAHLTEIFRKLGLADRVQLALLVSRGGMSDRLPESTPA